MLLKHAVKSIERQIKVSKLYTYFTFVLVEVENVFEISTHLKGSRIGTWVPNSHLSKLPLKIYLHNVSFIVT